MSINELMLDGDADFNARLENESKLRLNFLKVRDWRELVSPGELEEYKKLDKFKKALYEKANKDKSISDDKLREYLKAIEKAEKEQKKIIYKYDFKRFVDEIFEPLDGEELLQDKAPTPDFHLELYNAFMQSKRVCGVCPRGHGKSSAARIYILHQLLNGNFRYGVLIGSAEEMAAQNLRWIRDQLTDNPRIIDLYGELQNKAKWAETEFITATKIKLVAKGAGQKLRGANEKGRPDLIYIDDLEDDEAVNSRESRGKLVRWFKEAILPMKSKNGKFIITGTILHIDSLLRNIAKNMIRDHIKWDVLWYQAINKDKDGKEYALWEDVKPLSELVKLREIDPQTFSQEYQNNPTRGGMAVFKSEWFRFYKREDIIIDNTNKCVFVHGNRVNLMLSTDLAISEKEGADYNVLAVSGMDKDGNLFFLEVLRFRSEDVYETILLIFSLLRKWHCDYVTMEIVAFQKAIQKQIERSMDDEDFYFHIEEMKRYGTTKMARIKGLQSPIKNGKIFFLDEHTEYIEDEFMRMTATKLPPHDDFLDCFVKGTLVATKRGNVPIETINDNDYALTPFGYKKIKIHGVTRNAEVVTSKRLTGTLEHPVFDKKLGWVHLDTITDSWENGSILSIKETIAWRYKKLLSLMEGHTGSWVEENITLVNQVQMTEEKVLKDFILRFMSFILNKKFLKAFAFTIKMAIVLITSIATLSVFHAKNIKRSTRSLIWKSKESILKKLDHLLLFGINQKKGESGIASIQSNNVKKENHTLFRASTAENTWSQLILENQCSAQKCAELDIKQKTEDMKKQSHVSIAEKNIQSNIEHQKKSDSALRHAQTKQEVYNIHVEGCNVYYANNILVHNCVADSWEKQIESRADKTKEIEVVNSIEWLQKHGYLSDPYKRGNIRRNNRRGVR